MMSRVLKRLACQSALVCLLMAACTGAVITGDQFADEDVIASPEVDVHEETTTPDPTLTITTEVDPTEIEAGESVTVTCSAVDENGEPVDIEFAVLVTPDEGVTGDDFELTLTVAGSYEVACRVAPDGQVDDNPVTLTVNPGPAARVETSLDPPEVAASEESDVTCRMVDESISLATTPSATSACTFPPSSSTDTHRIKGWRPPTLVSGSARASAPGSRPVTLTNRAKSVPLLDTGNDSHRPAAGPAGLDVDAKNRFRKSGLRPTPATHPFPLTGRLGP